MTSVGEMLIEVISNEFSEAAKPLCEEVVWKHREESPSLPTRRQKHRTAVLSPSPRVKRNSSGGSRL